MNCFKNHLLPALILLNSCLFAQWTSLKPMPTARQEMPAALVNRKIYIFGGITTNLLENFVTKKNEAYDISTNTWKALKELPAPRHHHAVAVLEEKIYVIGGFDNISFNPVNTLFVYDTKTDTWARKQNLPVRAGAGDALTFRGKIYYFGGSNLQRDLDSVFCYDPVLDNWDFVTSMPVAREHISAALVDSLVYITAGRGGPDADKKLHIFDPVTSSWTTGPDLPTPRSGSDGISYDHRFYVLGGEGSRAFDEFEAYDPESGWVSLPLMPHARHGLGCVVLNDTLYAIGGATIPGFAPCAYNEAYIFQRIPTSLPGAAAAGNMAVYLDGQGELHIHLATIEPHGDLYVFDPEGRLVHKANIDPQAPVQLNTGNWSKGVYILTLEIGGKRFSGKLSYMK